MSHRLAVAALALAFTAGLRAQTPSFEAASIRRNTSASPSASSRALPGGRVAITDRTLANIIREVYRVQTYQIAGGPDWIDRDRWDIVAKGDGDPSFETVLAMMKTLLSERFHVVLHRELREMPIYALVLARTDGRLGPGIKPTELDCLAIAGAERERATSRPADGRPRCGVSMNTGRLRTGSAKMEDLARNLSFVSGRMTVDKTGLGGSFDMELNWNDSDEGPSLFTAMQEQLGLKLESQRGPVDVLVIDAAARPTDD